MAQSLWRCIDVVVIQKEEKSLGRNRNAARENCKEESFPLRRADNQFIISNLQRLPSGIYSVA